MTDVFRQTVAVLSAAGIESPRLETRMMLGGIIGCDDNGVGADVVLSPKQKQELDEMVRRRARHEPLDKILGFRDFYKYRFKVSRDVLSPRPDSETLVEAAVSIARRGRSKTILEFGVGSGCLILSILGDVPDMTGTGVDKSAAALKVAAANAESLGLSDRVVWRQCDYFSNDAVGQKFSMIISNPPYIPTADIAGLDKEVREYDPLMALDGGVDGYCHYRRLAEIVPPLLDEGGYVLLEAGMGQADTIAGIFEKQGLALENKICDLSGIERCIILKK